MSERHALTWIVASSAGALSFLIWLIYFSTPPGTVPAWANALPTANACFNSASTICMVLGVLAIKSGQRQRHMRWMVGALTSSGLFLFSYIAYHHFHGDTKFVGVGWIRWIYFFILISHIVLSAIVLPLLLTTVYFAITGRFEKHKPLARIVFPIWLYVSVTGVVVYFFLRGQY